MAYILKQECTYVHIRSYRLLQAWPTGPASGTAIRSQQSATAMYWTLKFMKSKYSSVWLTKILLSLYEQL